jgi:hypothetical protein
MQIRVDGMGLVKVSARYKKPLAKLRRGWGAEAVYLKLSDNRKAIEARVVYTGTNAHLIMAILKA